MSILALNHENRELLKVRVIGTQDRFKGGSTRYTFFIRLHCLALGKFEFLFMKCKRSLHI